MHSGNLWTHYQINSVIHLEMCVWTLSMELCIFNEDNVIIITLFFGLEIEY